MPGLRRFRGFTLIELLVVISVIAILTAIVASVSYSAIKNSKKRAAQTKCNEIAISVSKMLSEKNLLKKPLLQCVENKMSDPFSLADRIWIDWELNPENQRWYNRMNVSGSPYFPVINRQFKQGLPEAKKSEIPSYILKNFIEFRSDEIKDDPVSGSNPRAFDPWSQNTYRYVCFFQSVASNTFLVDGIVAFGLDGKSETVSPTPYTSPDNPYFNPDGADKSSDNTWTQIDQYLYHP